MLAWCGVARAKPPESEAKVAVGAFISNSYADPGLYDAWARDTGYRPVVLGSYKTWTIPLVDTPQLEEIWNRGAVPLVTWEPWDGGTASGVFRPGDLSSGAGVFRLRDIAAGVYDAYIDRSAAAAAAWGKPLFVRFGHEMNGAWYPWGRGSNGNTPSLYKAAWRHIVRAFRSAGAHNVNWVWGPNQNFSGRFPFRQYYPGDGWVDWVGLDGFNWARSPRWQSFDEIFAGSYNSVIELTSKPVMIVETGSWEEGGSKAVWVDSALNRELPRYKHVRAFLWWSVDDPRGDLRVESSPAALRTLRDALQSPPYQVSREELLATPAQLPEGSPVPVAGRKLTVGQHVRRELKDNYLWFGGGALAVFLILLALVLFRARRRRPAVPPTQDATL